MPQPPIQSRKKGDTGNPIRAQYLSNQTGAAIDLTDVSYVQFAMYRVNDDSTVTELVDAAGSVEDASNGIVRYEWQSGDTDEVGTHLAKFVLTWNSGEVESLPNHGYIEIRIGDLP